jgi:hypothetical protein
MSPTELGAFDKNLQTQDTQPKELDEQIAPDRRRCCQVLQAMLFTPRDWLIADETLHLTARLPTPASASTMTATSLPANRIASARAPSSCRSSTSVSSRRGRFGLMKPAEFKARGYLDYFEVVEVNQSRPEDIRTPFRMH